MVQRLGALSLFVPSLDAIQQITQSCSVLWRHVNLLQLSEGLAHQFAAALASKHLLADGLHNRAAQDALHHSKLQSVGRVVEQVELGLACAPKEGLSSVPAEILRNDNRGGRLAFTNDVTRCVGCRRFYVEVLIASKLSNERSGNVAFVLVNYQHR